MVPRNKGNIFGQRNRYQSPVERIVVMSPQPKQPHGMLGGDWQNRQVQVEHQDFKMCPGERCQPSVGLDGDFDNGDGTDASDSSAVIGRVAS